MTATTSEGDAAAARRHMRRALALARRGRTHPNPMVGAVVVSPDGRVVGEGWHRGVGTLHGEAMALVRAGDAARGATLYVTLEPCSHLRRPNGEPRYPCAARCLDAGVARVVAAMEDPDPLVSGRGFARLRDAGVEVVVGVCEEEARALLRAYVKHRATGLPYVLHKAAMTFDGKICAPGGDSKWITGEAARAHVHRIRDRVDAIVVGIGTVRADDPALTTRLPRGNGHDPLRVVIDSRLETPPGSRVARPGTLILGVEGSVAAHSERRRALEAAGAEVVLVPPATPDRDRVDLRAAMRVLAEKGALSVLLEGGGELAGAFYEAGLVDRALFFVAPKIIGGRDARTPVEGAGLSKHLSDALLLGTIIVRRFGSDVALEAEVLRGAAADTVDTGTIR